MRVIADVRRREDPAVSRSLHRATMRLVREAPVLSRLALRGALVALVIGGATALAGIALIAGTGVSGAAGLGAVLVAAAGYVVVFTTARYQAALAVAADAVLDHRAITRRRALAMAGGRWKDLMIWSVITVAPDRFRHIVSPDDTRSPHLTSPAVAGPVPHAPAPLISLLALPVIALETAGVPVALRRSTRLAASRWGDEAVCRFRRCPRAVTALLPLGLALALGGTAVALAADGAVLRGRGLIAACVGVVLAASGLAIHNASRSVLAVALFRYARDGRTHGPFDDAAMTRAAAPASNLIPLLTASGVLTPLDGRQRAVDRRYHQRWGRH
jgi:hypothetical protein